MPDFSTITEADRQLVIRGLVIQSLRDPGFETACRDIAIKLAGVSIFDELRRLLSTEPSNDIEAATRDAQDLFVEFQKGPEGSPSG